MTRSVLLGLLLIALPACGVGDDGGQLPGVDAGALEGEADAAAAACLGATPYMEACTSDDDCETCLCFTYGNGTRLCSQECAVDGDCQAPSGGCSGMGVCSRPGGGGGGGTGGG